MTKTKENRISSLLLPEFIKEVDNRFEDMWKSVGKELENITRKELAKSMFLSGVVMHAGFIDFQVSQTKEELKKDPETRKKFEGMIK